MITASKSLLILSVFLLTACSILPLYPFDYTPKTITTYALVLGFTLIIYLISIIPSLCFFMLCWRKFADRKELKYRINLFVSSIAIISSTALIFFQLFFIPHAAESYIAPLFPLMAASNHLIIFVISLALLTVWNKRPNQSIVGNG
jgi:hypothetical protein